MQNNSKEDGGNTHIDIQLFTIINTFAHFHKISNVLSEKCNKQDCHNITL